MTIPVESIRTVRRVIELIEFEHDNMLDAVLYPDFVDHSLAPGRIPPDQEKFKAKARSVDAFSNLTSRTEDILAIGRDGIATERRADVNDMGIQRQIGPLP